MKKYAILSASLFLLCPQAHALQAGVPVPECPSALADQGEKLNLGAYRGKVLLIDFWATWCPPCRKSMPFLNSVRNQRLRGGFEVIAINVDEDRGEAEKFLQAIAVDYQIAFDPAGECPRIFGLKAMPSSYLVDRQGTVRLIHQGYRDSDQDRIREQIDALLAE